MGIDRKRIRVTGKHKAIAEPHFAIEGAAGGVLIVLTQAFGPAGDNLVGLSDVEFDGHPALTIRVRAAGKEGDVQLSPIHGDDRKVGFTDIEPGIRCELLCPVSGKPLDRVPDVEGDESTDYYAIYLTPARSMGAIVAISDVWGHYHSRIVDHFELISSWIGDDDQD
jgi:hypothetical protein